MDEDILPTRLARALMLAPLIPEEDIEAYVDAYPSAIEPVPETLTDAQIDVLRCLSFGLTEEQVAFCLDISEHTVNSHAKAARYRLKSKNTLHAVATAIRLGYI